MPALIATANTCIAALANLEEWGMDMSKVKVISVLGSKQGVERVARERPEVEVGQALNDCTNAGLSISLRARRLRIRSGSLALTTS
jgi:uracil phosphoribosyltransferase